MELVLYDGTKPVNGAAHICIAKLSEYWDNVGYPHDIFILIFLIEYRFSAAFIKNMRIKIYMQ